ncbi:MULTISPECIES: STAS domain-containing protein [Undibacterium]|jgi:anti-anti-sigma factor|uniref:Anti-sigma factor antagonist n=1 Tax=Undibacterium umbellatum TaxID=2762300 RepID=A0ABR6Z6T9_9BURK|nr:MULTISPECIES: STAS domain-containing protein [Undibacterium]MBC3907373.1 STAS domain-containing protein [Undibacterium umbellatum]MDP1979456.1 STAS domain-containing protein [Undibacterium sp.]
MPNIKTFTPAGRLDSNNSAAFEKEILSAIDAGEVHILIDFSDLTYISSAGLRVILLTAKKTKAATGKLVLCSLSDSINEVFLVSGFNTILDIQANKDAALTRF